MSLRLLEVDVLPAEAVAGDNKIRPGCVIYDNTTRVCGRWETVTKRYGSLVCEFGVCDNLAQLLLFLCVGGAYGCKRW